MGCFVVKIAWMSLVSSMLGLMILGIRKINKKMPIQLISMFWLIFLTFLIIPFQFENIHNNLKITQPIGEIRENVLTRIEIQSQSSESINLWNIAFFAHLIVFAILCLKDICAYIILKYKIKNKKIELGPENLKLFDIAKKKLNFKRKVDLTLQDSILTPSTVGIFRPKILISKRFLTLSEKEQEFIFLHELMHIKKFDNIKYFLINILKNFYWFNPMINFLTRRLKEDIEILTDKLVIKHVEIKKYLILILKVSQFEASNVGAFPSFAANKKILERRIKIVKKERKLSLKVISLFAALIGALSVTGVALASPPKTTENSQESSQESPSKLSSSNLENNSSPENKTDNSGIEKKYIVKDFESGQTLKLNQKEFDEYMKKLNEKGYIELKIEDPEVMTSIEKEMLKDDAFKADFEGGCHIKELKWHKSQHCYAQNKPADH